MLLFVLSYLVNRHPQVPVSPAQYPFGGERKVSTSLKNLPSSSWASANKPFWLSISPRNDRDDHALWELWAHPWRGCKCPSNNPTSSVPQLPTYYLDWQVLMENSPECKPVWRRKILRNYCFTHTRQLSPILRFPSEIMEEIFLYSLLEDWKVNELQTIPFRPHDRAVTVLGQVCQFWRQVSLTTPKMWFKISISMYSPKAINFAMLDA